MLGRYYSLVSTDSYLIVQPTNIFEFGASFFSEKWLQAGISTPQVVQERETPQRQTPQREVPLDDDRASTELADTANFFLGEQILTLT